MYSKCICMYVLLLSDVFVCMNNVSVCMIIYRLIPF